MNPNPAILDHVTRKPRTTTEIATAARLPVRTVSAHLLRCWMHGHVQRETGPIRYSMPLQRTTTAGAPVRRKGRHRGHGRQRLIRAERERRVAAFLAAAPDASIATIADELAIPKTTAGVIVHRLVSAGAVAPLPPPPPLVDRLPKTRPYTTRAASRERVFDAIAAHPRVIRQRLGAALPGLCLKYIYELADDLVASGRVRAEVVARAGPKRFGYSVVEDAAVAAK